MGPRLNVARSYFDTSSWSVTVTSNASPVAVGLFSKLMVYGSGVRPSMKPPGPPGPTLSFGSMGALKGTGTRLRSGLQGPTYQSRWLAWYRWPHFGWRGGNFSMHRSPGTGQQSSGPKGQA